MTLIPMIIAFLSMIGVVITLAAAEKWKRELRQQVVQAKRQHDHGV